MLHPQAIRSCARIYIYCNIKYLIGGAGRGQCVMVYKDFEIIKQKNGKYAIIAGGYVIAFGRSVEACEDYIDELIYNE